ncbi:ADAMTS-like protein 5 [Acipenser ruthenus]|uniref:ADAMTS-like protein 5 n=1 Tax=Acipenser ruthenus TaxID=7906 RepID=A0A444V077_ACIRT|nr:ADAMTS-like protein 5 [Acipenser ruthenus]
MKEAISVAKRKSSVTAGCVFLAAGTCGVCRAAKGKTRRAQLYCSSDFVFRVKILSRVVQGSETRLEVQVKQTYKNRFGLVHREFVWLPDTCACPPVLEHREYVLMAVQHVNHERTLNRILVPRHGYARLWSPREDRLLRELDGHCRKPILGNRAHYQWVPFLGAPNPCDLHCLADGHNFYYTFGRALDGTSCHPQAEGVCVNGGCLVAGCDGVLGSGSRRDVCGVCGGRNDSCYLERRVFQGRLPSPGFFGYINVTRIPAGATSIRVTDSSRNYLGKENRESIQLSASAVYQKHAKYRERK